MLFQQVSNSICSLYFFFNFWPRNPFCFIVARVKRPYGARAHVVVVGGYGRLVVCMNQRPHEKLSSNKIKLMYSHSFIYAHNFLALSTFFSQNQTNSSRIVWICFLGIVVVTRHDGHNDAVAVTPWQNTNHTGHRGDTEKSWQCVVGRRERIEDNYILRLTQLGPFFNSNARQER